MDFRVQIDKSGRLLLPLELRKEIKVKAGDTMVLRKVNNEMKLLKFDDIIDEIHSIFAARKKEGTLMSDEVIKMRRQEAEAEK